CLPEAVPGTPSWDLGHDLSARAMRLVADGVVDREGVDGLAARLGYSARHVHRVLVAELGAGPVALARALRAQTARALLTGTDLRLADVAFAAGFGSVRQFNDTITEVFDTTPSELRRRARPDRAGRTGPGAPPGTTSPLPDVPETGGATTAVLALTLPLREPYDAPGVFASLAVGAAPPRAARPRRRRGPGRAARHGLAAPGRPGVRRRDDGGPRPHAPPARALRRARRVRVPRGARRRRRRGGRPRGARALLRA